VATINGKVTKGHDDDAAWDLHATEHAVVSDGFRRVISTGVTLELEPDEVALVCSRSGLAAKYGIFVLNAPGVIDAGYKGEVQVILQNLGGHAFWVEEGDRIAQLLILKLPEVAHLTEVINVGTARGANGLGSTGHGAA
jgi:dUTP pyrophosphatase